MNCLTTNDAVSTAPEVRLSLDELAREGARRMIVEALELEVDESASKLPQLRDEQDYALVVRNGSGKERTIQLVADAVRVKAPLGLGGERHPLWFLSPEPAVGHTEFLYHRSPVRIPSPPLPKPWMAINLHSAQSVFFVFLILGIVLGLA